ncbi:MAG: ATP-binding protein, partial [Chlamydiae bacterium]|nr:ATP-binding protein [Chlamydiota bacterium]
MHKLAAKTLAGRVDLLKLREFSVRETARLLHQELALTQKSALYEIFHLQDIGALQRYHSDLRPYHKVLIKALEQQLIWGGLPEVLQLASEKDRLRYLGNYLQTYLEKDIREISGIGDLTLYEHIMKVMAEQTGSVKEDQKIVKALNCSRNTLQKYQRYLQATWQYMEIEPFITNTLKRLVKSPK